MLSWLAEITHRISTVELLWTVPGCIGILIEPYMLLESLLEFQAKRKIAGRYQSKADRKVMWRIINGHIRNSALRMFIQAAIVSVGAIAMTQENPPAIAWTPLTLALTTLLIMVPWILCVQTVLDWFQLRFIQNQIG